MRRLEEKRVQDLIQSQQLQDMIETWDIIDLNTCSINEIGTYSQKHSLSKTIMSYMVSLYDRSRPTSSNSSSSDEKNLSTI